jgi:hypothetical protein
MSVKPGNSTLKVKYSDKGENKAAFNKFASCNLCIRTVYLVNTFIHLGAE